MSDEQPSQMAQAGLAQQAPEMGAGGYLPPRGLERKLFLALAVLVAALKVLTILHYRADSDETQHAHVVWALSHGQLQYRDVFDNHMPLFQMLCAPWFGLLGEHGYIMIELRAAMAPLYLLCLWCVFKLTERLFFVRAAPWVTMAAAALPQFFYTSTEFRTDDLWAAFWLLSLVVAVSGRFTMRRAFAFGLMLGLTFAVSLKTVVLVIALGTAAVFALALAWRRGERPPVAAGAARLGAIVCGAAIPLAATVLYFAWKGAFWIMYYCVVRHNVVPGLKRWGHFATHQWFFPVSLPVLGALGWLIFRQTPDTRLAMRRTIVLLTPWFFLCFLLSYWPDITREDDLPYTPLTPLALIPLLLWLRTSYRFPRIEARFFTWIAPAICFVELLFVWNLNPLRTDRLKNTTRSIADVLLLTRPGEYVMDPKSGYVFRPRPWYWVIETLTKTRIRDGLIKDNLAEALEKTGTPVCYLYSAHILPATSVFIMSNYMPFDPAAIDLGVAGKELGTPAADGTFTFDVAIPATYAIVSEMGETGGTLNGSPYPGPILLRAGHYIFHRTSGSGRAAIFLDRAQAAGFHPLFDTSETILKKETSRDE